MYAPSFRYHSPRTVSEAAKLLLEHKENAKILSGGMSLIPLMKMRLVSITHIVDIGKISEIKGISVDGGTVTIGASTTHHEIETSDLIRKNVPLMSEVASWIGDPQVRNRGTIGGALSHADPSGDWGACLIALKGSILASDGENEREIKSDDLFTDIFETSMNEGEILTKVKVRVSTGKGNGFAYLDMERKAGDFATVGVAVQIRIDEAGVCEDIGIGLTSLGRTSLRASRAEDFLKGKRISGSILEEASRMASEDADPSDDPLRGSAEFKREMCKVFAGRALKLAFERAGGVS